MAFGEELNPLRFTEPRVTEEPETEQEKPLVEEIPGGTGDGSDSSGPARLTRLRLRPRRRRLRLSRRNGSLKSGEAEASRWRRCTARAGAQTAATARAGPVKWVKRRRIHVRCAFRVRGRYVFKRDDAAGYYLDNPKPASRPRDGRHRRRSQRFGP